MEQAAAAAAEKPVMIVGVDDNHFLKPSAPNSPFKLVVIHSKPTPTSAIGFAGPGAADVYPFVDTDLKKIAARVVERAKELCHSKSVDDVIVEVVEGDARNVLCEAVDRHHATMLVVGSHGYGAIKRAVLGSKGWQNDGYFMQNIFLVHDVELDVWFPNFQEDDQDDLSSDGESQEGDVANKADNNKSNVDRVSKSSFVHENDTAHKDVNICKKEEVGSHSEDPFNIYC
nr:universal stress protein PHOS34 [Tanacetum cinerariifolium]